MIAITAALLLTSLVTGGLLAETLFGHRVVDATYKSLFGSLMVVAGLPGAFILSTAFAIAALTGAL